MNINRDLYETTEGRYAECAREMLVNMDFSHPTLNNDAHWTKPPLTYWAIAAGIYIADGGEWGVRLYLLFSFIGATVCVYWLADKIWGASAAPICALVYCTSLYPAVSSDIVSTDALLTFWEALVLLFFWIGFSERKAWAYIAMWSALGAAFMTKGPPGLLFFLAIAPTYYIGKRNGKGGPSLFSPIGIICFIVIGLGWYIYEAIQTPGLLHYWLGSEVYERVLTDHFKRNSHWTNIFTVYGTILLFGSMPWALVLLFHFKRIFQKSSRVFRSIFQPGYLHYFLLSMAIITPFIIFCISESRLHLYLLPLFVPISLLVGRGVFDFFEAVTLKRYFIGVLALALLLVCTGKIVVASKKSRKSMKPVAMQVDDVLASLDDKTELYYFGDQIPYSVQYYLGRPIEQIIVNNEDAKSHFTIQSIQQHFIVDLQSHIRPVVLVDRGHLTMLEDLLFGYAPNVEILNFSGRQVPSIPTPVPIDQEVEHSKSDVILIVIH
ncbi:MAG: glycosyltransferase family 39 protein [Candidatus Hinthialibacter antarcticus]|nr:glycosyltransferase family 39 protein [Candidatus Hinthialibacter antarcticus]